MAAVTGREGLDQLLEQREQALSLKSGTTAQSQKVIRPAATALAQLPPGPPCRVTSNRRDRVLKELANGGRHAAVLGPVLQLVRLSQQGHRGLVEVLTEIGEDFIGRVEPDRPGGAKEARQEWDKAVQGALSEVFSHARAPARHPCCSCVVDELRAALRNDEFFSGRGKLSERKILRYLFMRAEYKRTLLIQESQRQIAEAVDIRQPTVGKATDRLVRLGWLTRVPSNSRTDANAYLLGQPKRFISVSSRVPAAHPAGFLVDTVLNGYVHRLFGPRGLGPGPAEAFAALPEYSRPAGKGLLARVTPGVSFTPGLLNPYRGTRQIPRPSAGKGVTISELVQRTGKSRPTARRHLKRLADQGMVFEYHGRWWRYRFDPGVLADECRVPDTAAIKAERHRHDRRAYADWLAEGVRSAPGLVRVDQNGRSTYVQADTGVIRRSGPEDITESS